MAAKKTHLSLGFRASGPFGLVPADGSVLSMSGGEISSRIDCLIAVIDGPQAALDSVRAGLRQAFGPNGPADLLVQGEEEKYAHLVLDKLTREAASTWNLAIGLAFCIGDEVVLAGFGGAQVEICRANGELISPPATLRENDIGAVVWKSHLAQGDSVVLAGRQVAKLISRSELRQTVQASSSVEDAAEWLVTLTNSRGGGATTALVARVPPAKAMAPQVSLPIELETVRPFLPIPRMRTLGVGAAVAIALLVGVALGPALFNARSSAIQIQPPDGLQVVSNRAANVLLIWNNPSPGATGFIVKIGHIIYKTPSPFLHLGHVLTGGRVYTWQVQSLFSDETSRFSASGTLFVALARPLPTPTAVSPTGRLPVSAAGAVPFCWSSSQSYTRFTLLVSGDRSHFNRHPRRSALRRGAHRSACLIQALPDGNSYAWTLGGIATGHRESWTKWNHFTIAAPLPTATPTPLPPRRIIAPPTSAPIVSTPVPTQPPPPIQTQPAQPPPTQAPAPTPTPPVRACPNPPNC